MLIEAVQTMAPRYLTNERVKKIQSLLPEFKSRVNVGLYEPVKKENVEWLHKTFDELVLDITSGKPAAAAAPGAAPAATPGAVPVATPVQTK